MRGTLITKRRLDKEEKMLKLFLRENPTIRDEIESKVRVFHGLEGMVVEKPEAETKKKEKPEKPEKTEKLRKTRK